MLNIYPAPTFHIAIVCYKAGVELTACLEALCRQTYPKFSVIVIDNGACEGTPSPVSLLDDRISVVSMRSNVGFASGSNFGLRCQSADFLVTLNADCTPADDWLQRIVEASRVHTEAASFSSTQVQTGAPHLLDGWGDALSVFGLVWRGGYDELVASAPKEDRSVFGPSGSAAVYRQAWFRACEGFDGSFFCYVEDIDLAARLRLKGGTCVHVANAQLRHIGSASVGKDSAFQIIHGTRNAVALVAKTFPLILLPLALPAYFAIVLWSTHKDPVATRARHRRTGLYQGLLRLPGSLAHRRWKLAHVFGTCAFYDLLVFDYSRTKSRPIVSKPLVDKSV